MNKITKIIISLIFILALCSFTALAEDDYQFDRAEAFLTDLGVITEDKAPEGAITRAEFAALAVRITNTWDYYTEDPGYRDVNVNDKYYKEIRAAQALGIVSQAEYFNPNNSVSYHEAQKMLVSLLGYDEMARSLGGYPAGYANSASRLRLTDGVGTEAQFSYRSAVIMLYNAFEIKLADINFSDSEVYITTGDRTILWNFWGLTKVEGRFDGTEFYSENKTSGCGIGSTSFNSVIYNSGKFPTNDYFGMNAEIFVDEKSNIVSVYIEDNGNVITVYADDIAGYSNRVFSYEDANGKEKNITIPKDATILYNGCEFDYDKDKFIPEEGYVKFIKNGSAYSTIVIKSYVNTIVDAIDAENYLVIDKYDSSKNVVLDPEAEGTSLYNYDKKPITLDDITTGTILSVAKSPDGRVIEAIVMTDSIFGTCTALSDEGIIIDGQEFRLDKTMKAKMDSLISLGNQGIFYFDMEGKIANIERQSLDKSYGYMVKGVYYANGMDSRMMARILKPDGQMSEYNFAPTFRVNGTAFKNHKEAYDILKMPAYNSIRCDVILYTLNDSNEINSIEYADKTYGDDTGLYVTYEIPVSDNYSYFKAGGVNVVGYRIFLNTTSNIFKVPFPRAEVDGTINEKNYKVVTPASLTAGSPVEDYKMVGYSTNPESGIADFMLMQKTTEGDVSETISVEAYPYLVEKITQKVIDGMPCETMTVYNYYTNSTGQVVYSEEEGFFTKAGVVPGSIVRFAASEEGRVSVIQLMYKPGSAAFEDGTAEYKSSSDTVPVLNVKLSNAYKNRGEITELSPYNIELEAVTPSDIYPVKPGTFRIFKYDEQLKKVEMLTSPIIRDYAKYGEDCSKLIAHLRYGDPLTLFIVE